LRYLSVSTSTLMPRPVVSYDKELPELPEDLRRVLVPSVAYLRRKEGTNDQFEVADGRRPSKLLLVNRLRSEVDTWRLTYSGADAISRRLFEYWFEEDHEIEGQPFRYYFGQREAIETLVYLFGVKSIRDSKTLVETYAQTFGPVGTQQILPGLGIVHETDIDGTRFIRRYVPELEGAVSQKLPPPDLARYAFKMATGSGKTVVMAMASVWSFFHRLKVEGSCAASNFLLVAPNVIVYQRLEKDFGAGRIFHELPLIPPEWRGEWSVKVILRGEATEPAPTGNLFLTNVHQLHLSRDQAWSPVNPVEAMLGPRPSGGSETRERTMLARLRDLRDLAVLNDEAHHVHDEDLEWHASLMSLHKAVPHGLSMWLDFSATPKDQNGSYFPWVVCDYPLAQAVEDRIVKSPLIVHRVDRGDPPHVNRDNVIEAYGDWLLAALARWREHSKAYGPLGAKPVLFVMAEKNVYADEIGRWLVSSPDTQLSDREVLVIHTDDSGDIRAGDLDLAREAARDIDDPANPVKVVVSVLMLREGWDVRSVTVVLGLRPFTSDARILPEQAVGRGLRLLAGISPDHTQTLEVMGTQAFEDFVRQLEREGLGVRTVTKPPPAPIRVYPTKDRLQYDIEIPRVSPTYERNYRAIEEVDPRTLSAIYDREELDAPLRMKLRLETATGGIEVHELEIGRSQVRPAHEQLVRITTLVIERARLTEAFAVLYPIVRDYVKDRCFGRTVDPDAPAVRSHLESVNFRESVANYLAKVIGQASVTTVPLKLKERSLKLSRTAPFLWRRNLPLLECAKTIFNLVATYNEFEKDFARFLDRAPDVVRFAALGTTDQESAAKFSVNYVKPSGAIGLYYPDWVVIQRAGSEELSWIVETKGRVWEGTAAKDAAITHWCDEVTKLTGSTWRFVRVDQVPFERKHPRSFAQCTKVSTDTKSGPKRSNRS